MSAVINSKFKPVDMGKMTAVAAVLATLAFASVFVVLNFVIDKA